MIREIININPMEIRDWIELSAVIVVALGFGLTLYQMNLSTQNKINENSLNIMKLEKDILEMKRNHELEIKEMKLNLKETFAEFISENKKEHKEFSDQLRDLIVELTKITTSFANHERQMK